jgi:CheY-like chemotaxis protein
MKKILVVDDDPTTRRLIQGLLESSGYAVRTANDGFEGLSHVARGWFDLILVDVWMPRMTGLDLLAGLKSLARMPRAIVMTTDETPETLLRAVREQAHRFIQKPIDPKALLHEVGAVLALPDLPPIEVISGKPSWVELLVPCAIETANRIQDFMAKLEMDLPEEVRESVGLAFRELLMNAIEWGGELDPRRTVRISCLRSPRMLLFRIADPGKGFRFEGLEHSAVSNPSDDPVRHVQVREDKGIRAGGFGILITRKLVDELLYNEAQNDVVFVKYLDPSDAGSKSGGRTTALP